MLEIMESLISQG